MSITTTTHAVFLALLEQEVKGKSVAELEELRASFWPLWEVLEKAAAAADGRLQQAITVAADATDNEYRFLCLDIPDRCFEGPNRRFNPNPEPDAYGYTTLEQISWRVDYDPTPYRRALHEAHEREGTFLPKPELDSCPTG